MSHKKHWPEIDNLYVIGTVLVVFGHSHSSDWSTFAGTILENAINFVYTFHMPLFFFIAGFLFLNSDSLERKGFKQWAGQKVVRLMTPYLVLSLAVMIPKYYLETGSFAGFPEYLIRAVFIPRIGVWGHFWFLPVLLLVYLIAGFLRSYTMGQMSEILAGGAALLIYLLPWTTQWLGIGDLKDALIYFELGMRLYHHKQILQRNKPAWLRVAWILAGTTLSAVLVREAGTIQAALLAKIVLLISATLMITVCWQAAVLMGENRICRWISRNNLTIYIYSWPFQAVMMTMAGRLGLSWQLTSLSMFAAGLAAPVVIATIYENMPGLHHPVINLIVGTK